MALRIPLTSDQTLQTEFHEIERRLRKLEHATGTVAGTTNIRVIGGGGGGATVDLKPILERLDLLETQVAAGSDPASLIPNFGPEGATSVRGLVPEPGSAAQPTGIAGHVLLADAT
jgi:hypothetical protein